jgi:hypothetical protein
VAWAFAGYADIVWTTVAGCVVSETMVVPAVLLQKMGRFGFPGSPTPILDILAVGIVGIPTVLMWLSAADLLSATRESGTGAKQEVSSS